jgi:putative ABC transport system permease protein
MSQFNFIAKTAWRDSRKNRSRLFLFVSSIILGIAALVAINSFNYNLKRDIDRQAATLLGADMIVSARTAIPSTLLSVLDSLPGEQASAQELMSMAYFPDLDETSFVNIKAIQGDFPFYGKMKTEPEGAMRIYQTGQLALVGSSLMDQYGLKIGDPIKLGEQVFTIGARLLTDFGGNFTAGFAPAVYISAEYLPATNLVQPGSLINYNYYQKTPEDFQTDAWKKENQKLFRLDGVRLETVADRQENLKQAFGGLNYFLNLVALVSLLLGCLGVASSVLIYVKSKIPSIAIFRCLGMKGNSAFFIYFFQIVTLGLIGTIIGVVLGSGVQVILPLIMSDFLPFEVNMGISWKAIWEGLVIGFVITTLFALIPLVSIRNISPLRTLRSSYTNDQKKMDLLQFLIYGLIVGCLFLFLWILTNDALTGFLFTLGLVVSFAILFGVSRLIMWMVKKFFPRGWNFVFRQGLSNLFRPNNQTQTLLVSIGLGTAVLTTLFIIQGLILNSVAQMDAGNQPNMILFGIEDDQKAGVEALTTSLDMPIIQHVPVVTMRLEEWNGRTKSDWLADSTSGVESWAANREARVTYRDSLDISEKLVRGEFTRRRLHEDDSVFISLDEGYAEALGVDIGDELIFNVQGVRLPTYVSSMREIDFRNMQARFFIVFPAGVLEEAPKFHVLVTKSPNSQTTGAFRSEVVKLFSNVSVIDLGMILQSLGEIIKKVSYVIKFMAIFSILTGLIVLISSLFLSKLQRIKESVLLRTLGASQNQLLKITATEYALLGILSAATGIFIAIVSSWILATFQLELEFYIPWGQILMVFIFVVGLVVGIGLLNSRDVINKSPLEVLRREEG